MAKAEVSVKVGDLLEVIDALKRAEGLRVAVGEYLRAKEHLFEVDERTVEGDAAEAREAYARALDAMRCAWRTTNVREEVGR